MAIDFTLSNSRRDPQASAREFVTQVLSGVAEAIAPYAKPGDDPLAGAEDRIPAL